MNLYYYTTSILKKFYFKPMRIEKFAKITAVFQFYIILADSPLELRRPVVDCQNVIIRCGIKMSETTKRGNKVAIVGFALSLSPVPIVLLGILVGFVFLSTTGDIFQVFGMIYLSIGLAVVFMLAGSILSLIGLYKVWWRGARYQGFAIAGTVLSILNIIAGLLGLLSTFAASA